jgi:hypothetical protein
VTADELRAWVNHLGMERMALRVRTLEDRLMQLVDDNRRTVRQFPPAYPGRAGEIPAPDPAYTPEEASAPGLWEQLMYEGIMEGFGYAKNREPFLRLARILPLRMLRDKDLADANLMQAMLFGVAGLLPSPRRLPEKESRCYVRALRSSWRGARPLLKIPLMHEGEWLFFRLRPSNFPTARIAAMAFLLPSLFRHDPFPSLLTLFRSPAAPSEKTRRLAGMFVVTPDRYWSCHCHFRAHGGRIGVTLGTQRLGDLLVNTLIPLVLLHARIFRDGDARRGAWSLLGGLTRPRLNTVMRTMERELLKGRVEVKTALEAQGVLQLYRKYCVMGRCAECVVGKQCGW